MLKQVLGLESIRKTVWQEEVTGRQKSFLTAIWPLFSPQIRAQWWLNMWFYNFQISIYTFVIRGTLNTCIQIFVHNNLLSTAYMNISLWSVALHCGYFQLGAFERVWPKQIISEIINWNTITGNTPECWTAICWWDLSFVITSGCTLLCWKM